MRNILCRCLRRSMPHPGGGASGASGAGGGVGLSRISPMKSYMRRLHVPVMLEEAISLITAANGNMILDMTFGGGGHTRQLLERCPEATVFALDRDVDAYQLAQELATEHARLTPLHGKFSEVHRLLAMKGVGPGEMDAVLFDIGASSLQFDSDTRGFSLSQEGPLDMRMNQEGGPGGALQLVNRLDEESLAKIIRRYGEEKQARPIAKAIVDSRNAFGAITTTSQLAKVVDSVFHGEARQDKLRRSSHVATKTFQALRIFVNDEINELHNGLELAYQLLRPGGVCAVISFHSLEDRLVKRHFHGIDIDAKENMSIGDHFRSGRRLHSREVLDGYMQKRWSPLTKSVRCPTDEEVTTNPRARSAKLRAAVRI